jgi:hypothetical protein
MRTVAIPVKRKEPLGELARRGTRINSRTADYEGYVYQSRNYAGGDDPFIFIPDGGSDFNQFRL